MKSAGFYIMLEHFLAIVFCLVLIHTNAYANKNKDDIARSQYVYSGLPLNKGGWRPIVSSDNLAAYKFASVLGGHSIGQKIMTGSGPSVIETKVISPHILGVSPYTTEIFGNGLMSTSTRPIVTRDANKLQSVPQSYKTSLYPQNNINLNAPVKGYINPFSIPTGPGVSTYKIPPGFQFENMYMKHQQPILSHRPVYNKLPAHNNMGKRLKHGQPQSQMYQQMSSNIYHQPIQSYQSGIKKPIDSYQRPKEVYPRPSENYSKYNTIVHHHQNYVNPQDSLLTQTKSKHPTTQNVAAVTYKPSFSSHFQQFGIKEEPFGPIPSSILGSFSSFGHASVKAREPTHSSKINYSTTTGKPLVSTEILKVVTSTISAPVHEQKPAASIKQHSNTQGIVEDFTQSLVPPPKVVQFSHSLSRPEVKPSIKGNFIPSPPDPLNKHQNPPEVLKPTKTKQNEQQTYNTNLPTRRPEITSFFDTTSSLSTIDPFDSQSTNAIPENLLVQLPPPYTTPNPYNAQAPKKENQHVYHGKVPSKFNTFDTNQYFPQPTGHDLFGSKFPKNTQEGSIKDIYKGSYEVTETWGSSGETNTQPTLHTWINPVNPYKQQQQQQLAAGLKPPPFTFGISSSNEDRLIPVSFSPTGSNEQDSNRFIDSSTLYSTIEENDKNKGFFSQLENTIAESDKRPIGDEVFDLAAPLNISFTIDEKPKVTSTTPTYEEVTTQQFKRKPSRYRPHYESSTVSIIEDDYTTRFETFKEQTRVTENDLQINELPTIPPSKHFKRPVVTTTPTSVDNWDNDRYRKKNNNNNNKLRRRRPTKVTVSSTTEQDQSEDNVTDQPFRNNRFRTTTPSNVEGVTKPIRPKLRLPAYRSRLTTKPTSQPELTSSAQPTIIPTSPVTLRPRLHSRIRTTTIPSLDFDDLSEATTQRSGFKQSVESSNKQSSIMKIAKDHSHRSSTKKLHATLYESTKETPDYSHKQDEKDTPTSDISVSLSDHKYFSQKFNNDEILDSFNTPSNEEQYTVSTENAPLSSLELESYPSIVNIETSQTTRSEQFTELKSGNRGSIKLEKTQETQTEPINEEDVSTQAPNSNKRLKMKPGKFENTRPRFSVKDYRNRLSQVTSTSTDKPSFSSEMSITRLRFPNRNRFPSFKDQQDIKPAGSEVSTSTELPRKKFTPKDPRHRGSVGEEPEIETPQENEVLPKPTPKLRGGLRRDPNRVRTSAVIEATSNVTETTPQKSINTYTNLKRPSLHNRKRLSSKINATEAIDLSTLDVPTVANTDIPTVITEIVEEKNETSTEKYTSETAIMKIAKEERKHGNEEVADSSSMDQSQRVSDLTLASSKDLTLFKSVSPNTRKVPNYFTIATDDPILPIEAFFPQLNQKKEA